MPFVLDSFQDVVEQTASVDRISIFCLSPGRQVSHLRLGDLSSKLLNMT